MRITVLVDSLAPRALAARSLLCAMLLLTGCATSGVGAQVGPREESSDATAPVQLTLAVPRKAQERAIRSDAARRSASRSAEYVSPSTMTLSVTVTQNGQAGSSSYRFPCTAVACTASFPAPVGNDSIALSLSDVVTGTGNTLSLTAATPVVIQPRITNVLNLTADPVVARAAVLIGTTPGVAASTNAGAAATLPIVVQAFDADGNLIVGPGHFVDATGTPMRLSVSTINDPGSGSSAAVLSAGVLDAPQTAAIGIAYTGAPLTQSRIVLNSSSTLPNAVASATLTLVPTVTNEYALASTSSAPHGIALGPDGNVWVPELNAGQIARITPGGGVTEYTIPSPGSGPYSIAFGPDGNMWFAESNLAQVGRVSTSGTFAEFPLPTPASFPEGIAAGPDGNLWITELTGKIARMTVAGAATEYAVPTPGASLRYITAGPDGAMWFTELVAGKIGRITAAGVISEFPLPNSTCQPNQITTGTDGNIWFTEISGGKIGRITPGGIVTEFPVPTTASSLYGITAGPDGNMWFTENSANKIGRITPTGAVSEFPVPSTAAAPYAITVGSDGNLWFAESGNGKIGKLVY